NTLMGVVLLLVGGVSAVIAVFGNQAALLFLAAVGFIGTWRAGKLPEVSRNASRYDWRWIYTDINKPDVQEYEPSANSPRQRSCCSCSWRRHTHDTVDTKAPACNRRQVYAAPLTAGSSGSQPGTHRCRCWSPARPGRPRG